MSSTDIAHSPEYMEDEISLLDLLQVVADNLRLLVLGPLAAAGLALGVSLLIQPTFTAETRFLPPQQQGMSGGALASLGALGGVAGMVPGFKNPADQYVAFLKSNSIEDALIARFKLIERYEVTHKSNARKTLEGKVKIAAGKDGLITVTVDDHDPQMAADISNAYVEELTRFLGRLSLTEAQTRRQFFEKQLLQTKEKMVGAELDLKKAGVSADALKSTPQSAVAVVAALQAQVTAQEVKVGAMRGYLMESAPDFKQSLIELANLRAQLVKQSKDSIQNKVKGDAPGDYVSKYREFKYQEALFELFSKQFEMAKMDESREGAIPQVIDLATPPELKSKPQKAIIAVLAALSSGFILLLFVFVRQAMRNANNDADSAQKIQALKASLSRALGK